MYICCVHAGKQRNFFWHWMRPAIVRNTCQEGKGDYGNGRTKGREKEF